MRPIFIGLLTLLFVTIMPAFADDCLKLEIIYPKNDAKINASSTFIVGNTESGSILTINNQEAKVFPNGSFVQVISLNEGVNLINIKSENRHASKEIHYTLNVPEQKKVAPCNISPEPVSAIAQITKKYAVTRTAPGEDRLTPLPEGTLLNITESLGNNYRFKYSDSMGGWISKDDVKILPAGNFCPENTVNSLNIDTDENYMYIRLPLAQKIPFLIKQPAPDIMNLKLFGVSAGKDLFSCCHAGGFVKELNPVTESKDSLNLEIKANSKQFWGYKYYYEKNTLVLKLRKPPQTDFACPVKGKIICIDAGHGGTELGAVGPTGVPEKNINIGIADKLKTLLESKGAKVIMTRTSDKAVGLFDRVDIANSAEAQVIVSIHNNALPDGKNPYEEHGTTTYYYQPQSLPLVKILHQSLVKATEFKDMGVIQRSFVLTRPTEAPAVLLEVGFMIYPDEYTLLLTPEFQEKTAEGISQGLENFFLSNIEENK